MNYAEILAKLNKSRETALAKMAEIHKTAADEGRLFDDAEQVAFDTLEKEVEGLDRQIKSTEKMAKMMEGRTPAVTQVTDPAHPATTQKAAQPYITVTRNLPKGTVFTRYAMALAASKGNLHQASEIAKNLWSQSTPEVERIIKAAVAAGTTTDTTWAKPLAEYKEATGEFIELLRPATIIGKMTGLRPVPFNVRIPRQTAGTSVGWVGQGAAKPVNKLAFDSVTIPITKVAGIVVITQELARFSEPSAEALVRADLIETIAQFMDSQFLDPAVTATANRPASVTNGVTAIASTAGTVAAITADSSAAMLQLTSANIPLVNTYWIMSPRSAQYLADLRTAQDVFAFPGMSLPDGQKTFRGLPVIVSTGVVMTPSSPGPDETSITLVAAPQVMLADDGEVMLDVSTEAAVAMDDAGAGSLTSLWQNNLIGIRAERFVHWLKRRSAAVAVINSIEW